jgi:hypothetical protein
VEIIKAFFGLFTGLAWPCAVVLIFWWFQEEIAELIRRGFKFKGFGVEMEAAEEVKSAFETVKEATRPEAIEQVKSVATASVRVRLVESLDLLMKIAAEYPRHAIKRSWELLGGAILRAAKISGENVKPDSEQIANALNLLEANTQYSEDLVRSIRSLQQIALKVFYQHQWWAYDPSPKEAEQFVLYSAAARKDLGDKVE